MNRTPSGFTVLECLLLVSATSIVLLVVTTFVVSLLQARVKQQAIADVEQTGQRVLSRIASTIRSADTITAPAVGSNAPVLSLQTYDGAANPTVFDLSAGALRITEGAGSPVAITPSAISASNLSFTNLSAGSPGTLRITFTLASAPAGGRYEFEYAQSFTTSAALR